MERANIQEFPEKQTSHSPFQIYDILKQQNNLTRTVTANYTQDSEYNTLNSYFMFHFVYRLNTLGGKQMKGKRAPGGNHGGSRPYGGGRTSSMTIFTSDDDVNRNLFIQM